MILISLGSKLNDSGGFLIGSPDCASDGGVLAVFVEDFKGVPVQYGPS